MAEYRRFISYIYFYENGQKTENRGFVRVESRGNECRVHIHMTGFNAISDEELAAYMLYRENGGYIGIRIGKLDREISSTEWEFMTDSEHLMGTEYKLDIISGMVILGNAHSLYGTRWDDAPLDTGCFLEKTRVDENIVCFGCSDIENSLEEYSEDSQEDSPETEQIMVTALDGQDEQIDDPFAQMMHRFPQMYPFDDDSVEDCVRIELQDIGYLPMNYWFYGSNSFLLHSYYCYRHLILAKRHEGTYILGVPGIWRYRERYMASMFGFKYFKPISQSKISEGSFGYWYIELEDRYQGSIEN